jgi:hypothetical protein
MGFNQSMLLQRNPGLQLPESTPVSSFASRLPATLGEEVGVANRPDCAWSNEHQPPTTPVPLGTPTFGSASKGLLRRVKQ